MPNYRGGEMRKGQAKIIAELCKADSPCMECYNRKCADHPDYQERKPKLSILKQLKKLRKEQGFSQEYLAWMSGTSRATISRLENGHENVSFFALCDVVKALGYQVTVEFN
jgi:DNA-binding XRE family transcriptional regulator